jgi:hypothetical protein
VFLDQGGGTLKYAAAVSSAHATPDFQRGARRLDGYVNISFAAERHRGDRLLSSGIDIERIFATAGLHVPAVNEQLEVLQICLAIHFFS